MKKFNRSVHNSMGAMPPQIRAMIGGRDIAAATNEFNTAMTQIATEFHRQLANDVSPAQIQLTSPQIFGHDVKLEYIASGSVGSVYKLSVGDHAFAFKINRNSSHGELGVMPLQKRARALVNPMHFGAVFDFGGRKYSWVLSDYIADNRADSFESAMEKLYYMYLTKGLTITDAHVNNFKDGKLIDLPSLGNRDGKIDDIKQLSRGEVDMVKKLARCIKTDDMTNFERLIQRAITSAPNVLKYMFFAMKYGRPPIFGVNKMNDFSVRLRKYEDVVNRAYRQSKPHIVSSSDRTH